MPFIVVNHLSIEIKNDKQANKQQFYSNNLNLVSFYFGWFYLCVIVYMNAWSWKRCDIRWYRRVFVYLLVQIFTDHSLNYHVMNVSYCYLHEIRNRNGGREGKIIKTTNNRCLKDRVRISGKYHILLYGLHSCCLRNMIHSVNRRFWINNHS